jgi:hypothetical protein
MITSHTRLGRAERPGFKYCRHETLSLYAPLDVKAARDTAWDRKRFHYRKRRESYAPYDFREYNLAAPRMKTATMQYR